MSILGGDWNNAEKNIPLELCDELMFMGKEGDIFLYKHVCTRNYINIDNQGNFYEFVGWNGNEPGFYKEISKEEAIHDLLS